MVTMTTKKPVLGAVEAFPEVRAALREAPRDRPLAEELFARLGRELPAVRRPRRDPALARSRPFSWPPAEPEPPPGARRFRVAYAQDEAFGGYFPDTLEALESLGADLVEFSPLRDETLPDRADLVMIGCGCPRPPRRRPRPRTSA